MDWLSCERRHRSQQSTKGKWKGGGGGLARAVDVPAWAREHEPTTRGSRRQRKHSTSSDVKVDDAATGGGSRPYGIGTCLGVGTPSTEVDEETVATLTC